MAWFLSGNFRPRRRRRAWHAFGPRYTLRSLKTESGFAVVVVLGDEVIGTYRASTLDEAAAIACQAVAEDVLVRVRSDETADADLAWEPSGCSESDIRSELPCPRRQVCQ